MQVKVSENSAYERTLEVVLDQTRVDSAYDNAFGKAARHLALPGFRRGKVPLNMAKKYISEDRLGGDVVDELVPSAYQRALAQEKLRPISEPKWELVQRQRGKELIFKVKFEVRPTLAIEDYKGVALKAEEFAVNDEHVDKAVGEALTSHATLVPVEDRGMQDGDSAYVDYIATVGGVEFEGGKAENSLLEMKKDNFIPGFVDRVVGLEPGQEREFDINFPDEYPNPELAGKEVHFKFKVRELKEKKTPDLTDETVKAFSGLETVDELKAEMRERLQANAERRARESVSMRIIQKLLTQVVDDSVPRSLFQWRTNVEIRRRLQELSRAGMSIEQYLATIKSDQQTWVNQQAVVGMMEARIQVLLESIADKEDLDVKEDELEQLFQVEAAQRGVTIEQLKKMLEQENSEEMVRYAILSAKVRDFLFENASITYVAPGVPLEDEPAPEATPEAKPKSKGKAKAEAPAEESAAAPAETEEPKPKARAKKAKTEEVPESEAAAPAAEAEPEAEKPKPKRAAKKKTEE